MMIWMCFLDAFLMDVKDCTILIDEKILTYERFMKKYFYLGAVVLLYG
jgi:hypothetical protein